PSVTLTVPNIEPSALDVCRLAHRSVRVVGYRGDVIGAAQEQFPSKRAIFVLGPVCACSTAARASRSASPLMPATTVIAIANAAIAATARENIWLMVVLIQLTADSADTTASRQSSAAQLTPAEKESMQLLRRSTKANVRS